MLYLTFPYLTLPDHTTPHATLPYLTLTYLTSPYHTTPCPSSHNQVGMKERALKRKNRPARTLDLEADPLDHVTYLVYPTEENAQVSVYVCLCVCVCVSVCVCVCVHEMGVYRGRSLGLLSLGHTIIANTIRLSD